MIGDAPSINERLSQEPGDWLVRQMLSAEDLALSPEEYAARHAHEWLCFSYHLYRYEDSRIGTWVRRLGEILSSPEELACCRLHFLSPGERDAVRKYEAEEF